MIARSPREGGADKAIGRLRDNTSVVGLDPPAAPRHVGESRGGPAGIHAFLLTTRSLAKSQSQSQMV